MLRTDTSALEDLGIEAILENGAVTELKVYPGRPPFHLGIEGWAEVADYAVAWALRNAR